MNDQLAVGMTGGQLTGELSSFLPVGMKDQLPADVSGLLSVAMTDQSAGVNGQLFLHVIVNDLTVWVSDWLSVGVTGLSVEVTSNLSAWVTVVVIC